MHLSNSHHLWLLALESSMALSFFLSHQSFLEIKKLFFLSRKKEIEASDKSERLNDLLVEEKKCHQRYKKDIREEFLHFKNEEEKNADLLLSYRKLTDLFKERDEQNRELRETFSSKKLKWQKEVLSLQYSIEILKKHLKTSQEEKNKYLKVANDLRCSLFQGNTLSSHKVSQLRKMLYALSQKNTISNLEKKHLEEKIIHAQSQTKKLCMRLYELSLQLSQSQNDFKYKELKKQFAEKNAHLHAERKALFAANEKIAVFEKNEKEKNLHFSKDILQVLSETAKLETQNQYLETENNSLNEFVSSLLKKQKVVAVERNLPFS